MTNPHDIERGRLDRLRSRLRPKVSSGDELQARQTAVARRVVTALDAQQREDLLSWAKSLVALRQSSVGRLAKARSAVALTVKSGVAVKVVQITARRAKAIAWTDRSWAVRLGGIAAVGTATVAGGQGAGIAALGGAIGVPLWMVLGAGGAFAGVLIEELERARGGGDGEPEQSSSHAIEAIPEVEYEVIEEHLPNERPPLPPPSSS